MWLPRKRPKTSASPSAARQGAAARSSASSAAAQSSAPGPTGCVDLHCHILPGVDDGAADLDAALEIARAAVAQGIATTVATPHTYDGVFEVDRETARSALCVLQDALAEQQIPLRLRLAAEVRLHESVPDRLRRDPSLSLDGEGRYLLLELPHDSVPDNLGDYIFRMRAGGTTPLIAHPERNLAVRRNPELVGRWIGNGALMQLTAGSISGAFGPVIGGCAERILRDGHAHVIASDAHSMRKRPPILRDGFHAAAAIVGADAARALVLDNPRSIFEGAAVSSIVRLDPVEPPRAQHRRRLFAGSGRRR